MGEKIEPHEIFKDCVLLTYDIPKNLSSLRHRVLREIATMGGMGYTESVYLMPYSPETFDIANEIGKLAQVVIWVAHQHETEVVEQIVLSYDKFLYARCQLIESKLDKIEEAMAAGHLNNIPAMGRNAGKMIKGLLNIANTYSPPWFENDINKLVGKYKALFSGEGNGNKEKK